MIYEIANATQLKTALASAVGGDTLRLAAGSYGTYKIDAKLFNAPVRIESADPANRAKFTGLTIEDSANMVVSNIDLGRALNSGEPDFAVLNNVRNSENITLSGVTVHGSLDSNPQNDGRGMIVSNVRNFLLEDSLFTDLHKGLIISRSTNVVLRDSEWRTIRADGINVLSTEGLVIDNNDFSDFRPIVPDHGDAIQFFNTGQTKGSKNVTIENNRILITNYDGTEGTGTQGIFISDPLEFGYDNFLIRNNVLFSNGAFHGINVDGARQLQITGNSTLSKTGDSRDFWTRVTFSDGVVVDNNVADNFIFSNVTRLFQGQNSNLKIFPDLRALIPNLDNPSSVFDLITDEMGYQSESVSLKAPVSGALASALSGSIEPNQSQQAFKPVPVLEDAEEAPSFAAIFAATPVVEVAEPVASDLYAASGMPIWSLKDMISGHHFAIA